MHPMFLHITGIYRCGPAPVKAIQKRQIDLAYDVPFIYAEVNADVQVYIVRQAQILGSTTVTDRVGVLICTKSMGSNQPQDITCTYKHKKGEIGERERIFLIVFEDFFCLFCF